MLRTAFIGLTSLALLTELAQSVQIYDDVCSSLAAQINNGAGPPPPKTPQGGKGGKSAAGGKKGYNSYEDYEE